MKALFCDTPTFMHYKLWTEIEWTDLAGSSEIELFVMTTVIEELEKHKTFHKKAHLQDIAEDRLKRFSAVIDQGARIEFRKGLWLTIMDAAPHQIDFAAERLSKDLSDDWIIASVLQWSRENKDRDFALVTNDTGLKAKAFGRQLPVIALPDEYKNSAVEDPRDKEIRELKLKYSQLESRLPRLRLVTSIKAMDDRTIYEALTKAGYEDANAGFYERLHFYFQRQQSLQRWQITLLNEGTAYAEDIDIELTVPDHIVLRDKLEDPPEPPMMSMQGLANSIKHLHDFQFAERITNCIEHKVCFNVIVSKHGEETLLPMVFVTNQLEDQNKNIFSANYVIRGKNLPKPLDGSLSVNLLLQR